MENGSITNKDIIGWIVTIVISLAGSLVPLLIFYLNYRIYKKKEEEEKNKTNKKIENLEEMLYKNRKSKIKTRN